MPRRKVNQSDDESEGSKGSDDEENSNSVEDSNSSEDSDSDSDSSGKSDEDNKTKDSISLSKTDKEVDKASSRLVLMRRAARAKKNIRGKTTNELSGLMTYEDMLKQQGLQRMKEGLKKLLTMHSAAELSGICGCVQLPVQQKGNASLESILKYATEKGEIDEQRIRLIFRFMYEGVLWEYLMSIGHPVHSMLLDPRDTILKIWKEGGLLSNTEGFVPHFVVREVKKRYQWNVSEDIEQRLNEIRLAQERMKVAERRVISDHDYTYILQYFQTMGQLRNQETSLRDYLIAEVEICRARIDSNSDVSRLHRQQQAEIENSLMRVTNTLNEQLAHISFQLEEELHRRRELERDLRRVNAMLESYLDTEINRQAVGGGNMTRAIKLRELDKSPLVIRELCTRLQCYRDLRDDCDDALRERARSHADEIRRLKAALSDAEEKTRAALAEAQQQREEAAAARDQQHLAQRRLIRDKSEFDERVGQAWQTAVHYASEHSHLSLRCRRARPALVAGVFSTQPLVSRMSWAVLTALDILRDDPTEHRRLEECLEMQRVDRASRAFNEEQRRLDEERAAAAAMAAKEAADKAAKEAARKKKGAKGGKKIGGSSKRPGSSSSSKASKAKGGGGSNSNSRSGTPSKNNLKASSSVASVKSKSSATSKR